MNIKFDFEGLLGLGDQTKTGSGSELFQIRNVNHKGKRLNVANCTAKIKLSYSLHTHAKRWY